MQVPDSDTMSIDLRDLTLENGAARLAVVDLDRRIGDRRGRSMIRSVPSSMREGLDAMALGLLLADRAASR